MAKKWYPVGAITYAGDDIGWIPAVLREKSGMPDTTPHCGCGCNLWFAPFPALLAGVLTSVTRQVCL